MLLRSFLIKSGMITGLILLCLLTSGVTLAVMAPFHPGNIFFPLQDFSEQHISIVFIQPANLAHYRLDLFNRRIDDLGAVSGMQAELNALRYLGSALDQATLSISLVPEENAGDQLRERLLFLAQKANEKINALSGIPVENQQVVLSLKTKLDTVLLLLEKPGVTNKELSRITGVSSNDYSKPASSTPVTMAGVGLVPFPVGSAGANHTFYPLEGQHALLSCNTCHDRGTYKGTPDTCIQCHQQDLPADHYAADCSACHTAVSWQDVHFDHGTGKATDCISCHADKAPVGHYSAQCSACHNTHNWTSVTFNHDAAGATDCVTCHSQDRPSNHFAGKCSTCHSTDGWTPANFDHSANSDCASCHQGDKPANHYNGQCSSCHSTGNWQNATLDHSGLTDCVSCHAGDAPAQHYSGQCSNCHAPGSSWRNASFSHTGYTDCRSCHAGDAPSDHFAGQCSNCHATNGWGGASFTHDGLTDCASCHAGNAPSGHYSGQCSNCHNTSGWSGASFTHDGLTDCASCHAGAAPSGHYSGQCSNCHNTSGWGGASFTHEGLTDCISCHLKDRPSEHDDGQCSNCHNTRSWEASDASITNNVGWAEIDCNACHSPTLAMAQVVDVQIK